MPPRIASGSSGDSGPARHARGGAPRGGGTASSGRAAHGVGAARGGLQIGLPTSGAHITTVGVRRPDFGTAGKPFPICVNSFVTTIPKGLIYRYEGASITNRFILWIAESVRRCSL
jgi:eukaryotic translation initiation factor 2C